MNPSNLKNLEQIVCTFDEQFWSQVVTKLWQDAQHDEHDAAALHQAIVVVPDASMYVPFQAAWRAHARGLNQVCVMPRMMTLLDWAKSRGASDLDSARVERTLAWAAQLYNTPQLLAWLAGSDEADVFAIASAMVASSDELSLHFLANSKINQGEAFLRAAVERVYDAQAGICARQELDVLLQCWRADVTHNAPVIRYLSTLANLVAQPPIAQVHVVRNKPWSTHEEWFWQAYAQKAKVCVFDVQSIRALRNDASLKKAWSAAHERVVAQAHALSDDVRIYAAPHLEDEAQAIVRQVLEWRADGLKKIALVALDRTVSRRVWALLGRCGVALRDDTGWLLSTARCASSWQNGFDLWANEVQLVRLLDWLSHPAVLADWHEDDKESLRVYFKNLTHQSEYSLKNWAGWLKAARVHAANADDLKIQPKAIDFLQLALAHQKQFDSAQTMHKWVDVIIAWAQKFGMYQAWQRDAAGQVWLQLLEFWRGIESDVPLRFSMVLRVIQSEVERATFRPHDVSDEILLLPLGSTRMRDFDAVWLMGADADNLPSSASQTGLLNASARQVLCLPTDATQREQTLHDLIDIFARTPILRASYCTSKDGAPNALSTWLMQWLRASQATVVSTESERYEVMPTIAQRSQAQINTYMPSTISATDLATLAACPYQFYAKKILGLRMPNSLSDEIQPSDKGNLWHRVLAMFHERRSQKIERITAMDEADLKNCIDILLQPLCMNNARYWAVREVFVGYVTAYVAWLYAREVAGWRVESSEVWQFKDDDNLRWQGKIDEIQTRVHLDEVTAQSKNEYAIIDYKSGSIDKYQKDIKAERDIQLAFYLNLFDERAQQNITQAGYVGVTESAVDVSKYPQAWLNAATDSRDSSSLMTAAHQLKQQVRANFNAMQNGAALVAMGELSACQWCDVRGLCRKGYTQVGSAK